MQFKSIFAILAAGFSLVVATPPEVDTTVTSTSTATRTKTLTVTECDPTATACPGLWGKNTTVPRPTYGGKNSTEWVVPTGSKPDETKPLATTPAKTTPGSPIATGAAGGLFVQSGLMLGVLGAGIALVA